MRRIDPELPKPPFAIQMNETEADTLMQDLISLEENQGSSRVSRELVSLLRGYVASRG